jgi:hypothetical protein
MEVLSPADVKMAVLETISAMFETIQLEVDNSAAEIRERLLAHAKLS